MPQRKISVVFYAPDYEIRVFVPVTRITPDQLKQLQQNIANAKLPSDSCICSLSIKYQDEMSFLDGGARRDHITGRRHTLEISDLFYLKENAPACCAHSFRTDSGFMHNCARNLRAGRCRDEFMRNTIGAALFPALYGKDKQK